jgi:hypothetical protein
MSNRPPTDDEQTTKALPVTDENFDALWQDLKARMREARGDRPLIYTSDALPFGKAVGGVVRVCPLSVQGEGVNLYAQGNSLPEMIHMQREDLLALAGQCLGAVADMDELNKEQR